MDWLNALGSETVAPPFCTPCPAFRTRCRAGSEQPICHAPAPRVSLPGFTYLIERSTDGATWTAVGSVVVPANGLFEFLDGAPPASSVFYRTTVP